MKLRVARKSRMTERVVELELRSTDGTELPPWDPGAHIDLHLPGSFVRQYSLCDERPSRESWTICVSLDRQSRGGSKAVHEQVGHGDLLEVSEPRNNFSFSASDRYIFLAGGIGFTPLRSMIAAANDAGASWELHYGTETLDDVIYAEWLRSLGPQVHIWAANSDGYADFKSILSVENSSITVYACGPAGMLDAVHDAAAAAGCLDNLHIEKFRSEEIETDGDLAFEVVLDQAGLDFVVQPDETIMAAAERLGFEFPRSCEEGVCGSCITSVVSGDLDHRDSVLTDDEREEGMLIVPCVSRSANRLVLDC